MNFCFRYLCLVLLMGLFTCLSSQAMSVQVHLADTVDISVEIDGWNEKTEFEDSISGGVVSSDSSRLYLLTYMVDGLVHKSFQLGCGEPVEPAVEPLKAGYVFLGWSDAPALMPAHDLTIAGHFVRIGDVLEDGKTDVSDLTSLVGFMMQGAERLDRRTFRVCDVNGDGYVDAADYDSLMALILNVNQQRINDDEK